MHHLLPLDWCRPSRDWEVCLQVPGSKLQGLESRYSGRYQLDGNDGDYVLSATRPARLKGGYDERVGTKTPCTVTFLSPQHRNHLQQWRTDDDLQNAMPFLM